MPVIKCPKCSRCYDPKNEDQIEAGGDYFSVKVPCPACGQWIRLPEYECVEAPQVPEEMLKEMMGQSELLPEDYSGPIEYRQAKAVGGSKTSTMKIGGIILMVFGGLWVLSGLNLIFTQYDMSNSHDVSKAIGGLGFSVGLLAVGAFLLAKSKKAARQI